MIKENSIPFNPVEQTKNYWGENYWEYFVEDLLDEWFVEHYAIGDYQVATQGEEMLGDFVCVTILCPNGRVWEELIPVLSLDTPSNPIQQIKPLVEAWIESLAPGKQLSLLKEAS